MKTCWLPLLLFLSYFLLVQGRFHYQPPYQRTVIFEAVGRGFIDFKKVGSSSR
jgi:hypothetical protein